MRGTGAVVTARLSVVVVGAGLLAAACLGPSDNLVLTDRDDLTLQIVPNITPPLGDPATVQSARVHGHQLTFEVRYAGGCGSHRFAVATDGQEGLSLPPYVTLFIAHDGRGDQCEALVTRELSVDLRPLESVVSPGGTVLLRLADPDGVVVDLGELRYDF